jgi:GNAT superfamily N-acetyltransferase
MIRLLRIKFYQFLEHRRDHGFFAALSLSLYKREAAIPVKKELAGLKRPAQLPDALGLELLEIRAEQEPQRTLTHVLKSRDEKIPVFLAQGYQAFCLVKNNRIVGDVWYVTRQSAKRADIHPHLAWFGIEFGPDDVYMFDMYVTPECRGAGLATGFMNSAMSLLHKRGCRRAYGYYAAHNTSALWIHRLLGWEELPACILTRYLLFETARPKDAEQGWVRNGKVQSS